MRCLSLPCLLFSVALFSLTSFVLVLLLDLLPEHKEEFEDDYLSRPKLSDDPYQNPELRDNLTVRRERVFLDPEKPTDLPVIVWWTPFTPILRREAECPRGTCLITQSRTELTNPNTKVSAFVFYGTDFRLHDLPLPRQPHHLWTLLHEESPKNNWFLATPKGISLFNITSTFSRYSDYPLHLHYLHTFQLLLAPPRTPTHLKSKGSLGLVMFLQSACNPPSDRDSYVRELMKYVSVDCYGKCLHNKDLPERLVNPLTSLGVNNDAIMDIIGRYKFVLSFENALCHDYMTEKFWRPLYAGSVPIVRGSPTIRDWDPSGTHPSIIVADDFDSPESLARYLIELDSNDTAYNQYLRYKETGVTNQRLLDDYNARDWVVDGMGEGGNFIEGFECFVCDKLHERSYLHRHHHHQRDTGRDPDVGDEQLMIADSSHYDCPAPLPSVLARGQSVEERLAEMESDSRHELWHWMWTAKCAVKTAKSAVQAIARGADQKQLDKATERACFED